MGNFNYGNSFNTYDGENVGVQRIAIWKSAREFFPGGASLKPADYKSSISKIYGYDGQIIKGEVGEIVPAGTPISVDKPGGKPMLSTATSGANAVIGLTYEDVELGTDGCTFTIVTEGEFLLSRYGGSVEYTHLQAVIDRLFGRIKYIKEV